MGGISSMLGLAGGQSGTGIAAPTAAQIQSPTTSAQATQQYNNSQAALQQQQAFVDAVNQANGVGNLQNVFSQQNQLAGQLGQSGGLQAQQGALQGFQNIASGIGANVAQSQLNQATAANVANQAAMMAGQRGSNANVGMMARQAAQQGAATQQQAAGQAATLQAQQQQAALGQMASIGQGLTQAQAQQQAQMANTASTQSGQQAQALQGLNTATQGEQGQVLNAIQGQNQANVGMQSNINQANAGLANTQLTGQQNMMGNIAGGIGSAFGLGGGGAKAEGGIIHANSGFDGYAEIPAGTDPFANTPAAANSIQMPVNGNMPGSGMPAPSPESGGTANPMAQQPQSSQPPHKSFVGKFMAGYGNSANTADSNKLTGTALAGNVLGQGLGQGINALVNSFSSSPTPTPQTVAGGPQDAGAPSTSDIESTAAKGGKVPALLSPGEKYLSPKEVKKVANGKESPEKVGKKVPGKPKVPGAKNSYANDTVPATLEEGGVVIPRSITQGPNPHWEAMKFVRAIAAKNKGSL
jgi:hypothetical protein